MLNSPKSVQSKYVVTKMKTIASKIDKKRRDYSDYFWHNYIIFKCFKFVKRDLRAHYCKY